MLNADGVEEVSNRVSNRSKFAIFFGVSVLDCFLEFVHAWNHAPLVEAGHGVGTRMCDSHDGGCEGLIVQEDEEEGEEEEEDEAEEEEVDGEDGEEEEDGETGKGANGGENGVTSMEVGEGKKPLVHAARGQKFLNQNDKLYEAEGILKPSRKKANKKARKKATRNGVVNEEDDYDFADDFEGEEEGMEGVEGGMEGVEGEMEGKEGNEE